MRKDIIAIICPDVHGRTFWKDIAEEYDGSVPFIFLGDYLDPYSHEGITAEDAEMVFKELWEFINKWENVIPLIGNHDLSYLDKIFRCCRYSWHNALWYPDFLRENWEHFKIAYQLKNNGKTFLMTHAGIHPEWLKQNDLECIFDAGYINSLWTSNKLCFSDYSHYRGGSYWEIGSPVWADIREFEDYKDDVSSNYVQPKNVIQIVGHTQLEKDFIKIGNVYDIDSRQVYVITKDNKIEPYKRKED
jgi:hypothetical protein